jgi:hypothetical protein
MLDPIFYYNPETLLFPGLAENFAESGDLDPATLYLILDWKAARARTKQCARLAQVAGGSFAAAAHGIGADLHAASKPEQQLALLLRKPKWGFLLPTASAILAVLYPNTFTIYDIRVCKALGDFYNLGGMKWSANAWTEYQRFVAAVRDAAPEGLSLRDCDRWLWGRDKRQAMAAELASAEPECHNNSKRTTSCRS